MICYMSYASEEVLVKKLMTKEDDKVTKELKKEEKTLKKGTDTLKQRGVEKSDIVVMTSELNKVRKEKKEKSAKMVADTCVWYARDLYEVLLRRRPNVPYWHQPYLSNWVCVIKFTGDFGQ
eukprot:UN25568